jgi:hypothetical protein
MTDGRKRKRGRAELWKRRTGEGKRDNKFIKEGEK